MTTQTNTNRSKRVDLLPHQAAFIESFLQPGSAAYHHLVSPVGMGKTAMLARLIQRMVSESKATRILVLTRPSLLRMFEQILMEEGVEELPLKVVDKKVFRELEAASDAHTPWHAPIIAIMSIEIAKQEDVAPSLSAVTWDLVVVDEFHTTTGQRRQFLDHFAQSGAIVRLLLLSTKTSEELSPSGFRDLQVTQWPIEIRGWDGTLLFSPPSRIVKVMRYERSATEIEFIRSLNRYLDFRAPFKISNFEKQVLLRCASSSIYAVESALRNRRNRLVHGDFNANLPKEEIDEELGPDVEEIEEFPSPVSVIDSGLELIELEALLKKLDQIQIDSKADALRHLLSEILPKDDAPIIVFTKYTSTASFLHTYLGSTWPNVYLITANMAVSERADVVNRIRAMRGIVIASPISLQGLHLGKARFGVSFDLPQSQLELEQRWSAIGILYRGGESTMYALWDTTGSLPFEEIGLRKYGFFIDN